MRWVELYYRLTLQYWSTQQGYILQTKAMQLFLLRGRISYTEGSFSISRPSDLSPRQLCVTISWYRVTQRIHYTLTPQNQLTSHNWDLREDLICQALEMLIGFRVMKDTLPTFLEALYT